MTPKQQRFVEEYARLKNGRAAALVAAGVALAFQPQPQTHRRVMPFLTQRQQDFVAHYLILGNAAEAARRAGYSRRSARGISSRLLRLPQVAAAIAAANEARAAQLKIDAKRVLKEFARIGFVDPGLLLEPGPGGPRLRPLDTLSADERGALGEIVITEGKNATQIRVRLDKLRALESLARHLQLYKMPPPHPDDNKDWREELRARLFKLLGGVEPEPQDAAKSDDPTAAGETSAAQKP